MNNKQEILKEIILNKKIERPIVKKWHIACLILVFLMIICFSALLCLTTKLSVLNKLFVSLILLLLFFEGYMRLLLIQIIKCYQRYAREDIRRRCKCLPSCSEYSIICLQRIFPLVVCIVKIRTRLFKTCKGEEFLLDYPIKKEEEIFFSKYIKEKY